LSRECPAIGASSSDSRSLGPSDTPLELDSDSSTSILFLRTHFLAMTYTFFMSLAFIFFCFFLLCFDRLAFLLLGPASTMDWSLSDTSTTIGGSGSAGGWSVLGTKTGWPALVAAVSWSTSIAAVS
jgi:hypothetical protein